MPRRSSNLILGAVAIATALLALSLPAAMDARRAEREAALEIAVRTADIGLLEERVAADPDNWLLADHLAGLYAARFRTHADPTDITRAERLVRRSLPLRPDPTPGWVRLSSLLLTQHRFREAYEAARIASASPAPRDDALAVFVDAARAIGDDAAADSAFARMTPGTFAYAVRSAGTRPPEDALQQVEQACARLEERGSTRDLRAWCMTRLADIEIRRGRPEAGREWLDRALKTFPDDRGALEVAADLAHAEGRWEDARRLYARILSDAHPDLYLRLAEVSRELGRASEAEALEGRFLDIVRDPSLEPLFGLELARYLAANGDCVRALPIAERELSRRHSAEAVSGVADIRASCATHDSPLRGRRAGSP